MNARTHIDENAQIDPVELDQIALFNALGLDEQGQAQLVATWQQIAPGATLNEFTGALVKGSLALAQKMELQA